MKPVTPIHEPRVPPPAPPKYDYAAARAAGATPLLIVLHKAHRYLAKAYLVWMIAFVLGIIVYHSTGKPPWIIDKVVPALMTIWIAIWLASQLAIFMSHVFIRKMFLATIPSFFLHGFMMLFPGLNIVTVLAMAPELPGQNKPARPPQSPPTPTRAHQPTPSAPSEPRASTGQ